MDEKRSYELIELQTLMFDISDENVESIFVAVSNYINCSSSCEKMEILLSNIAILIETRPRQTNLILKLCLNLQRIQSSFNLVLFNYLLRSLSQSIQYFIYIGYLNGFFQFTLIFSTIKYMIKNGYIKKAFSLARWFSKDIKILHPKLHSKIAKFVFLKPTEIELFKGENTIELNNQFFNVIINDDIENIENFIAQKLGNNLLIKNKKVFSESSVLIDDTLTILDVCAFYNATNCFEYIYEHYFQTKNSVLASSTQLNKPFNLMHYAIAGGSISIVLYLTEKNNFNKKNCLNCSIYFHQNDLIDFFVDDLIENNLFAFDEIWGSPLFQACHSNNIFAFLYLSQKMEKENKIPFENEEEKKRIYFYLVKKGYIDLLRMFLCQNQPKFNVNETDEDGNTSLIISSMSNNITVINFLLNETDIDINKTNKINHSALSVAAYNGNINIVKLLLLKSLHKTEGRGNLLSNKIKNENENNDNENNDNKNNENENNENENENNEKDNKYIINVDNVYNALIIALEKKGNDDVVNFIIDCFSSSREKNSGPNCLYSLKNTIGKYIHILEKLSIESDNVKLFKNFDLIHNMKLICNTESNSGKNSDILLRTPLKGTQQNMRTNSSQDEKNTNDNNNINGNKNSLIITNKYIPLKIMKKIISCNAQKILEFIFENHFSIVNKNINLLAIACREEKESIIEYLLNFYCNKKEDSKLIDTNKDNSNSLNENENSSNSNNKVSTSNNKYGIIFEFMPDFPFFLVENRRLLSLLYQHHQFNLNKKNKDGDTLLTLCAQRSLVDSFEFLIKLPNIDINIANGSSLDAINEAFRNYCHPIFIMCLKHPSIDMTLSSFVPEKAIEIAVTHGDLESVMLVMKSYPNLKLDEPLPLLYDGNFIPFLRANEMTHKAKRDSVLELAIKNQKKEIVDYFYHLHPELIENSNENTIIIKEVYKEFEKAIENQDCDLAKSYLEKIKDVNFSFSDKNPNCTDSTPLTAAINSRNPKMIQLILNVEGVNINFPTSQHKHTPLVSAILTENMNIVMLLLSMPEININQTSGANFSCVSPLIKAISTQNRQLIDYLLNCDGIDVNVLKEDYGQKKLMTTSPLLESVSKHDVITVKRLLEFPNIDLEFKNMFGKTAYDLTQECYYSSNKELKEIGVMLAERGANTEKREAPNFCFQSIEPKKKSFYLKDIDKEKKSESDFFKFDSNWGKYNSNVENISISKNKKSKKSLFDKQPHQPLQPPQPPHPPQPPQPR